jgi:hypothetical protein
VWKWPELPRVIAAGRLDFGDLGAEVAKEFGSVRTGDALRQLKDAQAGER